MFKSVRNFISNHRRKFLFGGVFFGTLIVLARYARGKLREWQEKELNDLLERNRRRQHFENTERTCNQTVLLLSNELRTAITKCLDCEKVVNDLRSGTTDKISSWNRLKILAISRTVTIIYSYTMFVITLRIQFNIIAAAIYKNSIAANSQNVENIDNKVKESYLSLTRYLIETGIQKLSSLIQQKVKCATSYYSLGCKLDAQHINQIYWSILSLVSADESEDPVKNWSSYIIDPEFTKNNQTDKTLVKLLDDTLDLLESQEVQELMKINLRYGFATLCDRISEYLDANEGEAVKDDKLVNLKSVTITVAKIIPILNGQVPENPTSGDLPTYWLQRLLLSEELGTLGANIYEAIGY
ncbi:PREDICTED: peroxisomal biogenesis factor 3 [Ceratosolen solmsi marchali]|uniref:Peroxisomal biogenesis factor 3 n=1 Tax=Ceratosolen solmsi marchali TaxID=326594 RepID=A0AAJ6YXM1_9HYME|nr:PREDICTED: peroxisomal biogenesis factor 3 [Ceratosolen solmsi marchali]